ncbi:MAG: 50S ribosomal protein L21 [Acidobacteriota bacterium]
MYAVIHTGGKQYRVEAGKTIRVEKIESNAGDRLEITAVSLVRKDDGGLFLGTPWIDGARVLTTVVDQDRAKKVTIFKKKRRKQYRRTKGHRQAYTELRIDEIEAGQ